MDLKRKLILSRRLKNEMRKMRQQINKEEDQATKAKMVRAYRRMFETCFKR